MQMRFHTKKSGESAGLIQYIEFSRVNATSNEKTQGSQRALFNLRVFSCCVRLVFNLSGFLVLWGWAGQIVEFSRAPGPGKYPPTRLSQNLPRIEILSKHFDYIFFTEMPKRATATNFSGFFV